MQRISWRRPAWAPQPSMLSPGPWEVQFCNKKVPGPQGPCACHRWGRGHRLLFQSQERQVEAPPRPRGRPRGGGQGPALRHAPLRHTSWGKARSPTPRSALCSRSGHRSPARDKVWMCGLSVRDSHACPAAAPQAGAEAEPGVRTWVRTGAPLSPARLPGPAASADRPRPPCRSSRQVPADAEGAARTGTRQAPGSARPLSPAPRLLRTRPHARRVSR